jgi:hypothetical protein
MEPEGDNIYDRIQELFGDSPGNVNILQEQIDIDVQIEYFEHPRDFKTELTDEEIIGRKDGIFNKSMPSEDKKNLFVQLASVDQIEAYRAIESYIQSEPPDLIDWAKMALQENRMLLESKLLEESLVFISTGLGGKGLKLRYFIVFITEDHETIDEFRQRIISSELEYQLKRNNAELESIEFTNHWASFLCVIPMQESLKELFYNVIQECNNYGDFLRTNYIITNVKTLTDEEIHTFLEDKFDFDS